jgi:hypothetical protein
MKFFVGGRAGALPVVLNWQKFFFYDDDEIMLLTLVGDAIEDLISFYIIKSDLCGSYYCWIR